MPGDISQSQINELMEKGVTYFPWVLNKDFMVRRAKSSWPKEVIGHKRRAVLKERLQNDLKSI